MANLSANLETKAYTQGMPCPPLKAGVLRVYNMRFCPFAERALLALHAKNIPHEVVNINLDSKPDWYLQDKNPMGKVPTVEHDGKIVYDSGIVAEYLDQAYPQSYQLLFSDPLKRAHQRMLLERISDKLVGPFYATCMGADKSAAVLEAFQFIENCLENEYLDGKDPRFVDLMLFPFLERIGVLAELTENKVKITPENYPKLDAYVNRMANHPAVINVARPLEQHQPYLKAFADGAARDYDHGIPAA